MLVVKMGGAAGIEPEALLDELAALEEPWILVHGGNEELSALTRQLGHEPRFVRSPNGHESRVTDERTIDLIRMTYRGRINNDLVQRFQQRGVQAVGLSGVDGGIWQATRKEAIRVIEDGRKFLLRDDLTGRIHTVNTHLLRLLVDNGYRPVLTLPALADTGEAVNVDGDRAAAAVAAAMGAKELIILSNVRGLLRDPSDPESLVTRIPRAEMREYEPFAKGRFRKKLLAAEEALAGGVARVTLATTQSPSPISDARQGNGTVIT